MSARCVRAGLAIALLSAPLGALAQHSGLEGDWRLTLEEGNAPSTGILTFERAAQGLVAFVDGGPVPLTLDGNDVAFDIDYRDGGGRLLIRHLAGSLHTKEKTTRIG